MKHDKELFLPTRNKLNLAETVQPHLNPRPRPAFHLCKAYRRWDNLTHNEVKAAVINFNNSFVDKFPSMLWSRAELVSALPPG